MPFFSNQIELAAQEKGQKMNNAEQDVRIDLSLAVFFLVILGGGVFGRLGTTRDNIGPRMLRL